MVRRLISQALFTIFFEKNTVRITTYITQLSIFSISYTLLGMIKVHFKTDSFRKGLLAAQKRQIPFAIIRALKNTIVGTQGRLRRRLANDLILRRGSFIRRGIRVTFPSKQHLQAVVGSVDEYMAMQAEGGVKKGQGSSLYAFYPTKAIQPSKYTLVPRRKFPKKLRTSKRKRLPFVTQFRNSPTNVKFLVRRRTKRSLPLDVLWVLPQDRKVKKRWKFNEEVQDYVRQHWDSEMVRALDHALATAR